MSDTRRVIKVFLASPGDLVDERRAAKHVVDTFNKQWADHLTVHVELVGWEDTVSQFGRPQDLINRDLDQCELFIGIMWKHWGTPPQKGDGYTSGFHEEYERATDRRRKSKQPEICLLFKDIDPELLKDPGDSLRKVLQFKEDIQRERTVLYQSFGEIREFEDHVRGSITKYVQRVRSEESQKIAEASGTSVSEKGSNELQSRSQSQSLLSQEGAQFVREFVSKTEGDTESNPILPQEVARFRLLSSTLYANAGGNDTSTLGVHDANILYRHRNELTLSNRELIGLADVALDNFPHQNVPLWHWYTAINAFEKGFLSLTTLMGPLSQRIGALAAMTLLEEPIKPPPFLRKRDADGGRKRIVESWFRNNSEERLRVAALEYLGVCGTDSDLTIIREEIDAKRAIGAATEALVRLNLKRSREAAFSTLVELQPETISSFLLASLFAKPDAIDTSLLASAATHRNSNVRERAVRILSHRKELPEDIATRLLADTKAEVRYLALQALIDRGREYTDKEVENILVKPTRDGLGFGLGIAIPDSDGQFFWEKYKRDKLRKLSADALAQMQSANSVFSQDARFALDAKKFASRSGELRKDFDDEFRALFANSLKDLERRQSLDIENQSRIKDLEDHICNDFCRKALDLLTEKSEPIDLLRVRRSISGAKLDYSRGDVRYLERHGEWEDIQLLIKLYERADFETLLSSSFSNSRKTNDIASAIVALSKGRAKDLIEMEIPTPLRAQIFLRLPDQEIATLHNEDILNLLHSDSDQLRRIVALRAVKTLSKNRIQQLLNDYLSQMSHQYYNAIFWLDMGVSLPKRRAAVAAQRALEKES